MLPLMKIFLCRATRLHWIAGNRASLCSQFERQCDALHSSAM